MEFWPFKPSSCRIRAAGLLLAAWLPGSAAAQASAAGTAAVCRVPGDPARREWRLLRAGPDDAPQWSIVFSASTLDRPSVALPLPRAVPAIDGDRVTLSYRSANGGRSVEWVAAPGAASTLELYVNHGLEVNVERDLDPAVERMNTEGPIAVVCERPRARGPAAPRAGEWMVGAGLAWSVPILDSTVGRAYVIQTVSWGRELTSSGGPGILRGRFVWAIEVTPLFAQYSPQSAYGAGVAPLFWRWNFDPRGRWAPFAELSMGGVWTSVPVPEGTSSANFTAHAAFGTRIRLRQGSGGQVRASPRASAVLAFRFQHISNGNAIENNNPGVNAPMIWAGVSW